MRDLGRARPLQRFDVCIRPNDLGAVAAIEPFDALAGIAGELAQGVDRMRQHARQNLQRNVRRARLTGPLTTPADYINKSISSCTFLLTGNPCANCKTT